MDTAQLKKFAQEARKSLMGTVEAKLGVVLAEDSLARRESKSAVSALEGLINEIGKDQVIEKVAYTWFNRFCALRFMDANHYNKIGIVSPVEGQTQPEILAEAKMGYYDDSVVDAKNKEQINKLLNTSQDDAYKLLLVSYCNFLNKQLPFMFERINDYTELLMPDDLLSTNSVLSQTVAVLDKETCKDVEVIGWLYQYYITDLNELVYDGNMSKKRISKELLPAATQLFTPKWAVQYMVENSLGRLWLESHPDENFKSKLKYYLENKQDNDNATSENIKPQDIKILDPACGSGHILVVAFLILFEIYKSQGWQENEIPEMILKNNLYGLDICDRATQLSQFAVMMKAREYDRNIFNKVSELNICSIKDTNWLDNLVAQELMKGVRDENQAKEQIKLLQDTFKDAKEYGSIIDVRDFDFDFWNERINYFNQGGQMSMYTPIIKGRLRYIIKQAKIMQQKYDVAVTNPPYLSNSRMSQKLSDYITSHYKDEKSDFCAVFYKKMAEFFARNNGFISLITTNSWMFLKSFEPLRNYAINNLEFESLVDYGTELFEGKVGHNPIVAWVNKKTKPTKKLLAVRLVDFCYSRREEKKTEFFNKDNYYISDQKQFSFIPGTPIAYWASDKVKELFKNEKSLSEIASPKQGMATADNNRFLRFWNEVNVKNIGFGYKNREESKNSKLKWFPYNKGGAYRKWHGNTEYVVNWQHDGLELKNFEGSVLRSPDTYFNQCISWSKISSSDLSMRFFPYGFLYDVAGCSIFAKDERALKYILGFTNSSVVKKIIKSISSTLNYEVGQISSLPLITEIDDDLKNTIINKVNECISISKKDWDSFETSWDFTKHPLLKFGVSINSGMGDFAVADPVNLCKKEINLLYEKGTLK